MREKLKDYLYILPLALIVGITPLIVRYKKNRLGEVVSTYWTRNYNTDFFSYYKSLFFIGALLLTFLSFYIYIKKRNKLKKTIYYIPLSIYLLMIIFSTIFSEAKLTSLYGFPDRYEGMAVLIGYVLIVIFAINLINKQKDLSKENRGRLLTLTTLFSSYQNAEKHCQETTEALNLIAADDYIFRINALMTLGQIEASYSKHDASIQTFKKAYYLAREKDQLFMEINSLMNLILK